jgi:hypothetical protein
VSVESDGTELIVSMADSDSYLRFRPIGSEAILTEIFLCNDDRGLFFERVLGALMVRHAGDLHLRITWNTPERNSQGEFAEVRIIRGATAYPSLAAGREEHRAESPSPGGSGGGSVTLEENIPEPPLSALEKEVQELLDRAQRHWDEYQRLKKKR